MQGDLTRNRDSGRGNRAEHVANWYFRLNGFLSIPGFVVHPDLVAAHPRTEADLIAVRFPYSHETIAERTMEDDQRLLERAKPDQILIVLVEVKVGDCRINGPWTNESQGNTQRVIRRIGFAPEVAVDKIASVMYRHLRWEDERHVVQYVAVGSRSISQLQMRYPGLLQVTWDDIGRFLYRRFQSFPEKLPSGERIHSQWPDFGKTYGRCFSCIGSEDESSQAIRMYIETGRCKERS